MWGTLSGHSCKTLWLDTLVRHSYLTLLTWHSSKTLLRGTLTGHSCETLLLDALVRHSYLTQITHTDTFSAKTNITAATQICHTDTSSAKTNITAATQIILTDTSSANTKITAATNSQFDTLSGPLRTHSPLWRALRPSRKRLPTVADGCDRKRKTWRTQPHPQTPKWNGNPRYAFGKKRETFHQSRGKKTTSVCAWNKSSSLSNLKSLSAMDLCHYYTTKVAKANLSSLFGTMSVVSLAMHHTAFHIASSTGAAGVSVAFPNMLHIYACVWTCEICCSGSVLAETFFRICIKKQNCSAYSRLSANLSWPLISTILRSISTSVSSVLQTQTSAASRQQRRRRQQPQQPQQPNNANRRQVMCVSKRSQQNIFCLALWSPNAWIDIWAVDNSISVWDWVVRRVVACRNGFPCADAVLQSAACQILFIYIYIN